MNLYHVTNPETAQSILMGGFHDGDGNYLTTELPLGVWLTDDPISIDRRTATWRRAPACVFLRVELDADEADLALYASAVDAGRDGPPVVGGNYREWLIPADWLRGRLLRVAFVKDDDNLHEVLRRERKPVQALPPVREPRRWH